MHSIVNSKFKNQNAVGSPKARGGVANDNAKFKILFKNYWPVLSLIVLAVTARFLFLGLRPFDGDEGIIIKIAQSDSLKDLWAAVGNDVHPPLFHFLEYLLLGKFALSEISARFVPAVAGALTPLFVYLLFKKLISSKIALGVAVLTLFSATLSYQAAEARPYALLTLIFVAQLYFLLQTLTQRRWGQTVIFAFLTLLLVLTQYIGFIVIFGEGLYLLLRRRSALGATNIGAVVAALGLFALLWGERFIHQLAGRAGEQSQALNLKDNLIGLTNAFYRFGAGRLFLDLDPSISYNLDFLKGTPWLFLFFLLTIFIPLALIVRGTIVSYRVNRETFWLVVILAAPLVLAALASSEVGPRATRYLSFLAPFYYYFIAMGFLGVKNRIFWPLAITFGIIFAGVFAHSIYFERRKAGANEIARYLNQAAQPNNAVVIRGGFGGGEKLILRYYLGKTKDKFNLYDLYEDYQVGNLMSIKSRQPIAEVTRLKQDQTVWFYDLTYENSDWCVEKSPCEAVKLGKDKENKELVLYKF